jgi:hypothetical protein
VLLLVFLIVDVVGRREDEVGSNEEAGAQTGNPRLIAKTHIPNAVVSSSINIRIASLFTEGNCLTSSASRISRSSPKYISLRNYLLSIFIIAVISTILHLSSTKYRSKNTSTA